MNESWFDSGGQVEENHKLSAARLPLLLADEGSGQIGRNLYWVKNMYAVIKTGGKQYRVSAGQVIKIESLVAEPGGPISFDEVMAIFDGDNVRVGAPLVPGASVKATVIGHGRHPKVTIFKMRRRKHFQKRAGHRQDFTEVRIESIA